MTDHPYPPDWPIEPPHPDDPRFGEWLRPWRPTPAQRALVLDLLHRYVSRDHGFPHAFVMFHRDMRSEDCGPQMLVALLEHFAVTAIGAQGESLTLARLADDVEKAREDAAERAVS